VPKRAAPLYIYFFLGAMPQDFDDPEQHAQQFLHAPRDVPFFFPDFFIKSGKLPTLLDLTKSIPYKEGTAREKYFCFFPGIRAECDTHLYTGEQHA